MHIPPGMDAYNSSRAQCKNPVSFWQAKYSTEFGALMNAYSDVVQLAFAGHIHMDDFRVTVAGAPSLPLRITPSVSPIFKNNPAFSVMTYNVATASVSDITTYFLALSSPKPSWATEYQFDSAYGVTSFSAANLSNDRCGDTEWWPRTNEFRGILRSVDALTGQVFKFSLLFLRGNSFHSGNLQRLRLRGSISVAKALRRLRHVTESQLFRDAIRRI